MRYFGELLLDVGKENDALLFWSFFVAGQFFVQVVNIDLISSVFDLHPIVDLSWAIDRLWARAWWLIESSLRLAWDWDEELAIVI